MGKLGGREMTAGSDLDLIVLYDIDPEADPTSDGPRPLTGAQYFARFTQRLVTALTSLTNAGKLYEVDLRLRPSGRAGPVATRLSSFETYQLEEAWTWEHMALTRARVISASPVFSRRVEAVFSAVLSRPRDARRIAGDILDMRSAIAAEKGEGKTLEPQARRRRSGGCGVPGAVSRAGARRPPSGTGGYCHRPRAGHGRLPEPAAAGDVEVLSRACGLYQDLTQVLRLALDSHALSDEVSPALRALLARAGQMPDFATLDAIWRRHRARCARFSCGCWKGRRASEPAPRPHLAGGSLPHTTAVSFGARWHWPRLHRAAGG